ncbi:DUF5700 domain-containing putative Zn-dependent protease [Tissierella sp.]|uniref:DUF5700 domain-containing putative Zn-dependent protease n=1 Tax=Tissierella sp. TaxID=41274 RepID=UPI00304AC18C
MDFSVRFSSIKNMLELCKKLTTGNVERKDIENILKHEDYKFEFARYKGRVSEDEYTDYLLDLSNLNENDITNLDLKTHHSYYKDLLANLDFYREKLIELKSLLTTSLFNEQISIALKGLPEDIKLPDSNFIFTIGIGQSFGYVYQNGMHFDFLQLAKDKTISEFCSTIAHEVHHVGINAIYEQMDLNNISLESLFYLYFSGEGLAVKYCNNAEGILSKSIYSGVKNKGLDTFTWKYLNDDFYNTMTHFRKDINDIRNNNIKSVDELERLISQYWMNPYTAEQSKEEIPKLKHFRLYSFGNDIWGIIHDCFGKSAVFETLKNPEKFPMMFNKSLDKMGYGQFKI